MAGITKLRQSFLLIRLLEAQHEADMAHNEGHYPGDHELVGDDGGGAGAGVQLLAHGGKRGDAGRIEQAEDQKGVGRERGEEIGQIHTARGIHGEHGEGADDNLLGGDAGDEGGGHAPIAKAQRGEDGRGDFADFRDDAFIAVHHVELGVEILEEPDDDAGHEDDGEGLVDEVLGLFPHMHQNAAARGHAIGGELHDEGHGLAAEDEAIQKCAGQNGDNHAQKIDGKHHERSRGGEEGADEDAVDGELGAAAHEGREHDGHFAVTLARQRPRRHDGGHAATKADDERDKGGAGKANLAQQLVHHEGDARHVAAVLQQRKEEEERHNRGNERKHAAHAREHAIDDEGVHGGVDAEIAQRCVRGGGDAVQRLAEQAAQKGADHVKGQIKDSADNQNENRYAQIFMRQIIVQLNAAPLSLGVLGLVHGAHAELLDIGIAHIGQRGLAVRAERVFHLLREMPHDIALVGR